MPTKKIGDLPGRRECRDPGHNPPSMMVYENGIYEHECPSRHHKQTFVVNKPTFRATPEQCSKQEDQFREEIMRRTGRASWGIAKERAR